MPIWCLNDVRYRLMGFWLFDAFGYAKFNLTQPWARQALEHTNLGRQNIPVGLDTGLFKYSVQAITMPTKDQDENERRNKMKNQTDEKPDILDEASQTINGERLDTYGTPENSFQIIAEFWKTYLNHRFKINIILTPLDVGHLMSLFKHARLLGQRPNRDNYIDAIGYLALAADRLGGGIEECEK